MGLMSERIAECKAGRYIFRAKHFIGDNTMQHDSANAPYSPTIEACIRACNACVRACEYCADACLNSDTVAMMTECIRTCRDCADACSLCMRFMARNSDLVVEMCRLCAIACDICAEECEQHDHDHCRRCAEACRRCAEACRQVMEDED